MVQAAFLVRENNDTVQTKSILEQLNGGDYGLVWSSEQAIKEELRNPFSALTWTLYFTVALNSLGATVQGWDQTGTNGANLFWPCEFLGDDYDPLNAVASRSWIVGFVNACPYIAIGVLTAWLSDPVNDLLGRKWTIFVAAIFGVAAPLGSAFTQHWGQLAACRILLGIGMGLKEVTVPVMSAEISPARIRGSLVMSWQLFTALGILACCVANIIGLDLSQDPNRIWRYQLGSAFIPAALLLAGVPFIPESPRWLMRKGEVKKAYRSLRRFWKTDVQAARELYFIHTHLHPPSAFFEDEFHTERWTPVRAWRHIKDIIFNNKQRVRRAAVSSGVVMAAQQMCGINILSFYSTTIFATSKCSLDVGRSNLEAQPQPFCALQRDDAGRFRHDDRRALEFSLGFALINFLLALVAFGNIDRWGRRKLLLYNIPFMALFMLLSSTTYGKSHCSLALLATWLFLFAAFYSPSLGPVPFTYSAEVFPLSHRELGMSFAVAVNNIFGSLLGLMFPAMFDGRLNLKPAGAFGLFAAFNVINWFMVYFFVPETTGSSLEALDYVFSLRYKQHLKGEGPSRDKEAGEQPVRLRRLPGRLVDGMRPRGL